jgi:ferredoxin
MATYITEDCVNCGACVLECPNEAISERDGTYFVDGELCTECVGFHKREACQAACPAECCLPDPNRREDEAALITKVLCLHSDEETRQKFASGKFPSRFRG